MTLQQIKRKVELELENKRDELFHSVDAFVENQKKYEFNFKYLQIYGRLCKALENPPDVFTKIYQLQSLCNNNEITL